MGQTCIKINSEEEGSSKLVIEVTICIENNVSEQKTTSEGFFMLEDFHL